MESLETLIADKNLPNFLQDNKQTIRSIRKLAKKNLNSIREKKSEGVSVVDNFDDGSIWFVCAMHHVPEFKEDEYLQLVGKFLTNGHELRPKQNDEVVEKALGICGYVNFLEAATDEDVYKFLWSLYAIRAVHDTKEQRLLTALARKDTPYPGFVMDEEESDDDF